MGEHHEIRTLDRPPERCVVKRAPLVMRHYLDRAAPLVARLEQRPQHRVVGSRRCDRLAPAGQKPVDRDVERSRGVRGKRHAVGAWASQQSGKRIARLEHRHASRYRSGMHAAPHPAERVESVDDGAPHLGRLRTRGCRVIEVDHGVLPSVLPLHARNKAARVFRDNATFLKKMAFYRRNARSPKSHGRLCPDMHDFFPARKRCASKPFAHGVRFPRSARLRKRFPHTSRIKIVHIGHFLPPAVWDRTFRLKNARRRLSQARQRARHETHVGQSGARRAAGKTARGAPRTKQGSARGARTRQSSTRCARNSQSDPTETPAPSHIKPSRTRRAADQWHLQA